jgi:hypothetical protein
MAVTRRGWHILISSLLLLPPGTALAQAGVKAGVVASGLLPSKEDYRPFLGYEVDWVQYGVSYPFIGLQIGVFYTANISDKLAFQPELYLSQKGYRFSQTPLYDTSYRLQLIYLESAVLLKFKIPSRRRFRPGLLAGPFAALKLSSDRVVRIWGKQERGSLSSVKSLHYGAVFGFDTEFDAWSGQVIFDIRFSWGLSKIMTQPEDYTDLYDDPGTVRILAFAIMSGFRF